MCTHEYRRQRRLHQQKQYRRCGADRMVDQNRAIVEALEDPLYQLLIRHTVLCRLTQAILPVLQPPHGATHRPMRRPARRPTSLP